MFECSSLFLTQNDFVGVVQRKILDSAPTKLNTKNDVWESDNVKNNVCSMFH